MLTGVQVLMLSKGGTMYRHFKRFQAYVHNKRAPISGIIDIQLFQKDCPINYVCVTPISKRLAKAI